MLKISKDAKVPSFVFNWSMHSWMSSNAKSWTLMSPALDPPRLKLSRRNALAASKTSGAKPAGILIIQAQRWAQDSQQLLRVEKGQRWQRLQWSSLQYIRLAIWFCLEKSKPTCIKAVHTQLQTGGLPIKQGGPWFGVNCFTPSL